jgi:hypothetical protein
VIDHGVQLLPGTMQQNPDVALAQACDGRNILEFDRFKLSQPQNNLGSVEF